MSEFSHLVGVLDANHIAALRQVIAEVCHEEGVAPDDQEIRKAMADAILASRGGFEISSLKEAARAVTRNILSGYAVRAGDGASATQPTA
jgi:hypothetical protein